MLANVAQTGENKMTYKRPLLAIAVLVALVATGYLLTARPGAAVQKKLTNRKGPRTLPPSVKSEVEGLAITNVRFENGDEMTAYDIINNTDRSVLSVVVRAANASLTLDADPGAVLIPPGGLRVGRIITDNIKDDTPLVLSAATFEGETAEGSPEDVRDMQEYRREKRGRGGK
ncbi:MAG: hypothetical protein LC785_17035 [Acidobacteria bacterium]|nr:hypothetical protein [Acidobacteriota bacterium]MCA1643602.1 hypothetical protein [Acidobacteriota bacterium]